MSSPNPGSAPGQCTGFGEGKLVWRSQPVRSKVHAKQKSQSVSPVPIKQPVCSWRKPVAPHGRAHTGGPHWRRSTRAPLGPPWSRGAADKQQLLNTSACDTGREAPGSPPLHLPGAAAAPSKPGLVCRRCCSCFPASPEKPPQSHQALAKPLSHCTAEQTPGRACPQAPKTSQSPQVPPALPNFALPLPSAFIKSSQELPPPPSDFHQFALANGEMRFGLGAFFCQNGP